MSLKEKLSHFWNETLGPDYKEIENIETSDNPELSELKESLGRIEKIENKFSSTGKKGGKGNSEIVKKVDVKSTNVKSPTEIKKTVKESQEKGNERE